MIMVRVSNGDKSERKKNFFQFWYAPTMFRETAVRGVLIQGSLRWWSQVFSKDYKVLFLVTNFITVTKTLKSCKSQQLDTFSLT